MPLIGIILLNLANHAKPIAHFVLKPIIVKFVKLIIHSNQMDHALRIQQHAQNSSIGILPQKKCEGCASAC